MCGCDMGGDCLCYCEAILGYVKQCLSFNVVINWRKKMPECRECNFYFILSSKNQFRNYLEVEHGIDIHVKWDRVQNPSKCTKHEQLNQIKTFQRFNANGLRSSSTADRPVTTSVESRLARTTPPTSASSSALAPLELCLLIANQILA